MNALTIADATLGLLVLVRMMCIIDHMGPSTCHLMRAAGVLLAASALAVAVRPWYIATAPEWPTVLMHAALAGWLWVDRRQFGGLMAWLKSHRGVG